ncbi:2-oxoisovalerate dehydrogenase subunit alpha, mitochondrial [Rhodotorula toruloides]|nr:2-oxoisovalerate dehydrogenase subunit alpha, mitochondrial [Rhodotorula toruloides]
MLVRQTALTLARRGTRTLATTAIRSHTPLTETCSSPHFFDAVHKGTIPSFRLLGPDGVLVKDAEEEWVQRAKGEDGEKLKRMLEVMTMLPILDQILYSSQRQGRISFYMTGYGEEGTVVGSAAAWENDDEVFAQYREVGVLIWRDYPLSSLMAQVFSTASDIATKGRQMPVHYGSREHHFHTISSPLGTQLPQAAGAAYALKRTPGRENSCVVCYAGEGATSEGDFHAGLNSASPERFAANEADGDVDAVASVLGGPLVYVVRPRSFAISTPVSQQYAGDGIAARGPGYGIETVRVDGNDPLAVYLACKEARRKAVEGQKPVLVEAMTYRVGHHSTSDDSSAYRSLSAVESVKKLDSPIHRLRRYLESLSPALWSAEHDAKIKDESKRAILREFSKAEKEKKPQLAEMFGDVFAPVQGEEGQRYGGLERPQYEQKAELKRLIEKWGETQTWKKELEKFAGGKEAVAKW